jgi:hypothetical protein
MSEDDARGPVRIPLDALDADTLRRVAEEIVTRDGTDYGEVERSLEEKVARLLRELESGRAALWFDPETGTTSAEPEP